MTAYGSIETGKARDGASTSWPSGDPDLFCCCRACDARAHAGSTLIEGTYRRRALRGSSRRSAAVLIEHSSAAGTDAT